MKAFHNDSKIKEKYTQRLKMHAEQDEIIKGIYWEEGKGCAIGCTIHSSNHEDYEKELGIPIILAQLEDSIFEKLPNDLAKIWPLRFLESINVGADLSKIWPNFAIYLLTDESQCNSRHPQCNIVAECFKAELNGEEIDWGAIRKNASAAIVSSYTTYTTYTTYAAYASSVDATYTSYATAYSAAYADASSAAYFAADVAASVYNITKEKVLIYQSEKLLELLRDATA